MSRTAHHRRSPKRTSKYHKAAPAPAPVITGNEPVVEIVSLDMEARGVGRIESEDGTPGKVIFVEGALPGERVSYSTHRSKPKFEQAEVVQVFRESVMRTKPKCTYFDICGGCSMQHLDIRAQVAVKQRVLEDNLQHLAKLRPETVFRPIHGPAWGYRYRARLAVRF
ncbi:MAG: 23S rRNA (uracil(1939)-C(5))-methyltransferase, partial [Burkholderia sp.]|nr:23S rRNA (uracil(1939)-C(5))-methyltransferase [Burkholderia sp.]